MIIKLSEMGFRIFLVESQSDEKFHKGKCFSFDIKDDWCGGIVDRIDTSCQPKWVLNWPSGFCYHEVVTCSWGYGYNPLAVEFCFFNFILVLKIFIQVKHHYLQFCQLVSARCRLDGTACGGVKTVSKNGKFRFPSTMANIFFSLVWGFLVCRRI